MQVPTGIIIKDIKTSLGDDPDSDDFSSEQIMFINAALSRLSQLGTNLVQIKTGEETWDMLVDEEDKDTIGMIQEYVYISTKLVFDPPTTSGVLSYFQARQQMLEVCIEVNVDNKRR